jgi:hypothetical protein
LTFIIVSKQTLGIMSYESRQFRKAEMACELAHEDAENDTQYGRSASQFEVGYYNELKAMSGRTPEQDMELIALQKRYGWD